MAVMRTPQEHIETLGSSIDDTLTPSDHDANAVDLKGTVDYISSQLADILGETNWYDTPDESVADLAARAKLEDTLAETEYKSITDVTVPNGQNYMILTAAAMLPTFKNKAIATDAIGLVTAEAGTFGSQHNLDELAGDTTITPRNLLAIVDGATGDPILDSDEKIIWGLLQHEATAGDETAFTDTTPERAMVSFVVQNDARTDLEAVAVADIEDKVINIAYARRQALSSRVPQDWMHRSAWVDIPTGSAAVTLNNAIDNQGTTPATQATDIEWRIDDDVDLTFETSDGGRTILGISPAAAGDTVTVNADSVDFNLGAAGTFDVDNGITVDSGGTAINLGVTAGQIDSASALTVDSTGGKLTLDGNSGVDIAGGSSEIDVTTTGTVDVNAAALQLDGTDTTNLTMTADDAGAKVLTVEAANGGAGDADVHIKAKDDINFTTDEESTGIDLDDATTGPISGVGTGSHASIAAAIKDAYENGGVDLTFKRFAIASNYAKDANVPAASQDLTAFDMDLAGGSPDIFHFLQGRLIDGADAADEGDIYPGTTPASGDVKFSYPGGVKTGWLLMSIGLKQ